MANNAGAIRRAYGDSRYGQLHYRIVVPRSAPAAPPLLCLHQTPANGRDWEPVLAELAGHRVVIAPDTPGYGMSDPPPQPVDITDFAAVMLQFMSDLVAAAVVAPGPFDVMGMHTGSITAVEMARAQPDRVRKLVLFGLAAYDTDTRAQRLAQLADRFPLPQNDLSHVEKLWSVISRLSDPRKSAEDRHIGMAECLRLGARMPWGYIAVYRYDLLAAMTQVRQPTLIINPEDDLWAVTRATSQLLPQGRRLDMPGVAHGVLTIEKYKVVAAIEEFLAFC